MASTTSWPKWMPAPQQASFSMRPEDRRIASSTVGTAFFRGFGGDVCTADCTVVLNQLQSEWLEEFERDVLVHGSKWFKFPLWYSGEVHWEKCRFKTRPKISGFTGKSTEYQFTLYVEKRSELIRECLFKLLSCWPPCFFSKFNGGIDEAFSHLSNVTASNIASAMEN